MKKWWMSIVAGFALFLAGCSSSTSGSGGGVASDIWMKILSVGNLSFLGLSDGSIVVAFTRLLIWLFVFTVFFAVITVFGGRSGTALGFLNRGQAMVVALVIATITAIFLPAQVLLATGAGWATIVALVLIGGPVIGIGLLIFRVPGMITTPGRGVIFLQLLLSLLLLWILMAMKFHLSRMI